MILLIGDFDDDFTNGKEILTNQIAKQLRTNDIKLVYISDKTHTSPFPATVKAIPSAQFPTKVKNAYQIFNYFKPFSYTFSCNLKKFWLV